MFHLFMDTVLVSNWLKCEVNNNEKIMAILNLFYLYFVAILKLFSEKLLK